MDTTSTDAAELEPLKSTKRVDKGLKTARMVLDLKETGKSQSEIAQIVGVSQNRVGQIVSELAEPLKRAQAYLQNNAELIARALIRHAQTDPQTALELGDRIGLVLKREKNSGSQTQINVSLNGFYGAPGSTNQVNT